MSLPLPSFTASVTSPYFTNPSPPQPSVAKEVEESDHEVEKDTNAELFLFKDPLFHFYFRRFRALYSELSHLKPILIQETVAADPWKLLVAVTLLNKTSGKLAIPVFWKIIAQWPDPWALSQAQLSVLASQLRPLGTYRIRSKRLVQMSVHYLRDPPRYGDPRRSRSGVKLSNRTSRSQKYPLTPISHLPGTGAYALDSYRIFCSKNDNAGGNDEWKVVMPNDKELITFLRWKWAFSERTKWDPQEGIIGKVDMNYLKWLIEYLIERKKGGLVNS